MTVQDAVLRLERAGSESSKTTQKLREAVDVTASKIVEILDAADLRPDCAPIGLGHMIDPQSRAGLQQDLRRGKAKWGGIGSYYYSPGKRRLWTGCAEEDGEILNYSNVDRNNYQEPSRENCLMFAKHVADGLLGLVAEWLENRTADEVRAIARLEVK